MTAGKWLIPDPSSQCGWTWLEWLQAGTAVSTHCTGEKLRRSPRWSGGSWRWMTGGEVGDEGCFEAAHYNHDVGI